MPFNDLAKFQQEQKAKKPKKRSLLDPAKPQQKSNLDQASDAAHAKFIQDQNNQQNNIPSTLENQESTKTTNDTTAQTITIDTTVNTSLQMPTEQNTRNSVRVANLNSIVETKNGPENPFAKEMDDEKMNDDSNEVDEKAEKLRQKEEEQKWARFTVSRISFTRDIYEKFYKFFSFSETVEEGLEKLKSFHKPENFKFYDYHPPNMLIKTFDNKAILCHQQILENNSGYFFVKIQECFEKFPNEDFPIIDFTDYDFHQVYACLKFFYKHELEIEHSNMSEDMSVLVKILQSKVLSLRFEVIKSKYHKYKLYQHGDSHVYSKKGHKIYHRGAKRVGESEADSDSILGHSKIFKYGNGGNRGDESCLASDLCSSVLSKLSTASSYHNSLLNRQSGTRAKY